MSDRIRVVDSRWVEAISAVRRRRSCGNCLTRWTTYEVEASALDRLGKNETKFQSILSQFARLLVENGLAAPATIGAPAKLTDQPNNQTTPSHP